MNYTLSQIASVTGGTLYGAERHVSAVATDSRSPMAEQSLFVALTGDKRDGHDYIDQMIERGCRAFLVERLEERWAQSAASFVLVNNSLSALQTLAAHHRTAFKGRVVAITGSNGKTVVKEWFAQLWDVSNGALAKSPRSYNSQLGVALSLLSIRGDENVALIEAGISERGEMERLEAMIRPDVGVLTNVGEAHSENFGGSKEEILKEKLKLFKNCPVVIRGDLFENTTIEEHNAHIVKEIYRLLKVSHLPVESIEPVALRLEVQQGVSGSEIINDSYNSDLTSIATALDFQQRTTNRTERILIVSDIEQSAVKGAELYGRVAELVHNYQIDKVIGIGSEIRAHSTLFDGLHAQFYGSTADFLSSIFIPDFEGCSVLLKGSRSFAFERISRALELRTHTTTLEVNLSRLVENFTKYRSMIAPGVKTMAMLKASAYGAGGVIVAKKLIEAGVSYLAVAFADEGVALRQGGIGAPIVVLNSDPGSFSVMIEHNLEPEIYSFDSLAQYERAVRREGISAAPIHLKLDTGMHRLGFLEHELGELCKTLKNNNLLEVKSIFSHLSSADDPAQDDFTRGQIALFGAMSQKIIDELCLENCIRSLANSAGTERFEAAHFDMVRLGIGLYTDVSTLKTRVVQVKTVEKGESVGYNRRSICERTTRLAILPVGYADGMDRRLSRGVGRVNIGGVLYPTIGNICMDTTIVDVTDAASEVSSGDEAVIFGPAHPTADEVAETIGTISYEILTSISPRIKRLYVVD